MQKYTFDKQNREQAKIPTNIRTFDVTLQAQHHTSSEVATTNVSGRRLVIERILSLQGTVRDCTAAVTDDERRDR